MALQQRLPKNILHLLTRFRSFWYFLNFHVCVSFPSLESPPCPDCLLVATIKIMTLKIRWPQVTSQGHHQELVFAPLYFPSVPVAQLLSGL